ncbi:arsenate reductase/protein-tyrosine-phosphatase family protein [Serratia fonticola]
MFNSILVVCVGNICRSPTGERLLKKYLPTKKVSSAGIGALVGHQADDRASEVSMKHGISVDGHIARQLTSSLCRENDLILVMEQGHIEAVCDICPEVRGKIMLYGHWNDKLEIVDPYKKSIEVFEHVFTQLENATIKWVNVLNR